MDLDVLFLGTAGAVPTAQRGPAAYLVRRGGERILVDCGEGTQRQMLRSSAGLADIDLALITHFHADHVLGLPGMLKTFALRAREAPLTIHGPSWPAGADRLARPRDRPAVVSAVAGRAGAGSDAAARRLPDRAVRHRPPGGKPRLRAVRGHQARSVRHGDGNGAGGAVRAAVRGAAARTAGDARIGRGRDARAGGGTAAAGSPGRVLGRHASLLRHAGGVSRRRPAGARGHVPRGGDAIVPRRPGTAPRSRRRSWRSTPRSRCWR